ncbi:NAD-dependent epimerase/dehydratase family protein [Candidatus Parcubacteria bacterium]|nr:MAG: NAD-dependent epimerase/dehydratase family protein [Candidatus Parcubacteria bacterium]
MSPDLSLKLQPYNPPLRWLITGGCGFIGTSLIKQLVEEGGHAIRVIDNLSVGTREDLARVSAFKEIPPAKLIAHRSLLSPTINSVELIVGDILDEELALKVTKDIDVIVHLAANTGVAPSVKDPRKDCVTNVIGTLNYLEGARRNGVKRFVFASSGAPLGEQEPPLHEEMAPHPVSPYGASKLAGEGYCSAYYRTFGVETVVLRFGNVYGPGSGHKNSVVAKFIKQALAGETLEIYGDGTQTRDFIYIDDQVRAIRLAATKDGVGGEIFQIATNQETTVQEMLEVLLQVMKEAGIPEPKVIHGEKRQGDVMRNYSDTSKARDKLGWCAGMKLGDGLRKTLKYFL